MLVTGIAVSAPTEAVSDHQRVGLVSELEGDMNMEVGSVTDPLHFYAHGCESSDTPVPRAWVQGRCIVHPWEGGTKVSLVQIYCCANMEQAPIHISTLTDHSI